MFNNLIHEVLYYLVAISGAATLSHGLMKIIDHLEGRTKK